MDIVSKDKEKEGILLHFFDPLNNYRNPLLLVFPSFFFYLWTDLKWYCYEKTPLSDAQHEIAVQKFIDEGNIVKSVEYVSKDESIDKNEKFQKKIQKKEQEFVAAKDFSSTTQLDVKNFIAHNINMVRNILNSELIKTFNGNVILSGDAVSEFFAPHLSSSPLIMHSSAKIKHMGISRYQLNKPIGTFFRDNLSISTNPFMPLNPCSASFDHDGVLSKKVSIIEKGIFKNYLADKQYADYLNVPPTGAFGSVDISGGTSSLDKMYNSYKTLPYIEIVAFSSFVPNNISGDFSAEIRLGYIVVKDKQGNAIKTPFKGGLFTGNVFKLIENIYISKEIKEETGYKGPKAVMFENSVVAGIK